MKILKILIPFIYLLKSSLAHALAELPSFPDNYEKKRIIISTDIGGGDKDDTQSMIHFLIYSNMFDLEGIVISRPQGDIKEMEKVLRAYRRDYSKLVFTSSDYLEPGKLSKLVKIGAKAKGKTPKQGYDSPSQGSRWIVKQAHKKDLRPLHIVCWGSTTDVAQALHDSPSIATKIRLYAGGTKGYNYQLDPAPTDYLRKNYPNLRWIDSDGSGQGLYKKGLHSYSKYGNIGFVRQVIRPRGSLGRLFYRVSSLINVNRYGLKMGDSTSILFLMNGSFRNPMKPSWGGKYCKVAPNRFTGCSDDSSTESESIRIVSNYRLAILKDWEKRLTQVYSNETT